MAPTTQNFDVFVGGEAFELSQHVVLICEGGNLSVKTGFSYRLQRERRLSAHLEYLVISDRFPS
jgi:hypothetical protein